MASYSLPQGWRLAPSSALRSYALVPLFLAGTILDIASLVLIFKKPRIAAITGIIAAIMYVFLAPGDQAEVFFVGVRVPVGVTINEVVALIASIVVLLFAPMVYLANRKIRESLGIIDVPTRGSVERFSV